MADQSFYVKILYDFIIYKFLLLIKKMSSSLDPTREFNQW